MISITVSCEKDELPAVREVLAGLGSKSVKPGAIEKDDIGEEQRATILQLHHEGHSIQDIKASLGLRNGRQISGIVHSEAGLEAMYGRQSPKAERVPVSAGAPGPKAEQLEKPQVLEEKESQKPDTVALQDAAASQPEAGKKDAPKPEAVKSRKQDKVRIPDELKPQILRLYAIGKNSAEIAKELSIPNPRQVWGVILQSKRHKAKPLGAPAAGSGPAGGSRGQQNSNASERSPMAESADPVTRQEPDPTAPTPEARPYTRAALNGLIWDLHRAGKDNDEISDELYRKGYCFSADFVRERLKKIEEGRA